MSTPILKGRPILKRRGKNDPAAVRDLQKMLTSIGYTVAVDGVFGGMTETAVRQFQHHRFLLVDGVVGPQTWTAITNAEFENRSPVAPLLPPSPWYEIAFREMERGVNELPGSADNNPRIIEYFTATNYRATKDETPWCSAFANWCMREAGIPGTRSAAARSWLKWGEEAADDPPRIGTVVVLRRGKGWQGHVGFYHSTERGRLMLLGGNQGNRVSIASYRATDVLGLRWPSDSSSSS